MSIGKLFGFPSIKCTFIDQIARGLVFGSGIVLPAPVIKINVITK